MNHKKDILKMLIVLSIPTVIEQIMSTLLQYVDTAMVGHLGEKATAAVSTTTTVNWLVSSVPYAFGIAFLALIAKESGAKNEKNTKKLAAQTFHVVAVIGVVMTIVCLLLSPYIPVWMNAEKDIRKDASDYFFIVSTVMLFRTGTVIFGSALRAVKNTKTPMAVNLFSNILNIILNTLFIYGLHLGVRGAVLSSAISYGLGGLLMFLFMQREEMLKFSVKDIKFESDVMKKCMKIAIPALGNNVASCAGYVVFAGMVSGMGTVIFAAHSIAVTAEELFYIPGYGLRTAASSLIGNAIGENDRKKTETTSKLTVWITVFMMIISGVILYFISYPLMRIFTNSTAVAEIGASVLRLVAFTEPFFGLMIALEGIFYGMGQTKEIFFIETFSMWGIRIVLTFLCTQVWHLSLYAVWYCMIADNIFKAVVLLIVYFFQKKKMLTKNLK